MNEITISGKKIGNLEFSHQTKNEKFYAFFLSSARKSGIEDIIPCIASEVFKKKIESISDSKIKLSGEIRTRNVMKDNGKTHLEIFVFINDISAYENELEDINDVFINGYTCNNILCRQTPLGRQIADMIIACNRRNNKSDYIPCIAWGRNAVKMSEFENGKNIILTGRLQSREYTKKIDEELSEIRIVYEVSANGIEVLNNEN